MNIRLWKARASEKLGVMRDRERVALRSADYCNGHLCNSKTPLFLNIVTYTYTESNF